MTSHPSLVDVYESLFQSPVFLFVLPCVNLLIGSLTIFLNTLTGQFFGTRTKSTMHLIYFVLACSDWVAGAALVIQGLCLILFSVNSVLLARACPVFYFLGQVALHTSAMYTVLLTMVRSVSITKCPTYSVNRRVTIFIIVIIPVFWTGIVLSEILLAKYLLYPPENQTGRNLTIVNVKDMIVFPRPGGAIVYSIACKTGLISPDDCRTDHNVILDYITTFVTLILPYGAPIVFCLISTIYQLCHLILKKSPKLKVSRARRRLTKTIIVLTTTFLLFDSIQFTTIIITIKLHFNLTLALVVAFASSPLLCLNSLITPLVMCFRGKSLNEYVRMKLSFLTKTPNLVKTNAIDQDPMVIRSIQTYV